MVDEATELTFDRAAYSQAATPGGPPCGNCRGPLGASYYTWQTLVVCPRCKPVVEASLATSRSSAVFGKAALLGGLAALGCGAAYAVVAHLTKSHLAIATIGIAFVIAKVVRKASGGVSGLRFQILAVALAYVGGTMGYLPDVIAAFTSLSIERVVIAAAITLAAPLLTFTSAPLGVLIIAFGLWEAWRLTRGLPLTLQGPFHAAPAAPAKDP
jgi:hypothetical protein